MTEEKKNEQEAAPPSESSGGSIMKYLLIGLVGAVVVAGIAFGTMVFLSKDKAPVADDMEDTVSADSLTHDSHPAEREEKGIETDSGSHEDSHNDNLGDIFDMDEPPTEEELLAEMEQSGSAISQIKNQLEFLDFEPDMNELDGGTNGMSVEDSLEQVNWLESEKKRLAEREESLKKREHEQQKLEQKLNRQILRIEQVESSRISSLAKLYDGMEPRAVAKLVANLDDNTVVSIIPRMKQKNASQVLALMPPKRAARLSRKMITISDE